MAAISRIAYRARQFWSALTAPRGPVPGDRLLPHLTPSQIVLFRRLQPSEQRHACRVLDRLQVAGHREPDLLAAALLHDVGKILVPLSLWERVWIVLAKRFLPRAAAGWGRGRPQGWARALVVAARHPEWGADLAARAGASPRTVGLIRRHQEADGKRDILLAALQAADDQA